MGNVEFEALWWRLTLSIGCLDGRLAIVLMLVLVTRVLTRWTRVLTRLTRRVISVI
jgi:hypothetical protein